MEREKTDEMQLAIQTVCSLSPLPRLSFSPLPWSDSLLGIFVCFPPLYVFYCCFFLSLYLSRSLPPLPLISPLLLLLISLCSPFCWRISLDSSLTHAAQIGLVPCPPSSSSSSSSFFSLSISIPLSL